VDCGVLEVEVNLLNGTHFFICFFITAMAKIRDGEDKRWRR
jgi:hypothetical protein